MRREPESPSSETARWDGGGPRARDVAIRSHGMRRGERSNDEDEAPGRDLGWHDDSSVGVARIGILDSESGVVALYAVTLELLREEPSRARGEVAWEQYWADWPFGEEALLDVLAQIARSDGFEGLIDRVESLPEETAEDFRAKAIRGVAGLGGRIDPARTVPFVEAHADSPLEGLRNLRAPFADAWAQSDPMAALDWLMSQPAGHRRNAAMRIAYRSWALDPTTAVEAIEWIEAQPAEVLPPVLDFYALALVPIDPDRAIAAAERIEAANRDMILKRVRRRVERRARTAADGEEDP